MPPTDFTERRFEVQPDHPDTRDRLYECSPDLPPAEIPLETYLEFAGPVLDQGREPSCTGMALAGVANYMMRRHWHREAEPVSPRMMYEMARRHDHLSDDLEGSNPRGAIKGWHKHGVCSEALWPYTECVKHGRLTFERVVDASRRLMEGYVRVDSADLDAIKWAIAERGVLFANSMLHEGWDKLGEDHVIPHNPGDTSRGGHAFMLVGYDDRGFWIQNSWAESWGRDGCAVLTYEDWLENGMDVWLAEVDVEGLERGEQLAAGATVGDGSKLALFQEMWPHVVVVGGDGRLTRHGSFSAPPEDLVALIEHFEDVTQYWPAPRLAIVTGAGLRPLSEAVREIVALREELLDRQIYPLFVLWKTDWLGRFVGMLEMLEAAGEYDGDQASHAEWFERAVSRSQAKDAWREITKRADLAATAADGAVRILVEQVLGAYHRHPFEIHLVAHGVGDVLASGLAVAIGEDEQAEIASCTLWAPATTIERFDATYRPLLKQGALSHLGVFALDDARECADSVGPYEHSILYLASRGLGPPLEDDEILGMQRVLDGNKRLRKLRKKGRLNVVIAPTEDGVSPLRTSHATTHAGFAQDPATIEATVERILGGSDAVPDEIESRDPLVRARAQHRAAQRRRPPVVREPIHECEDCAKMRATPSVGS